MENLINLLQSFIAEEIENSGITLKSGKDEVISFESEYA